MEKQVLRQIIIDQAHIGLPQPFIYRDIFENIKPLIHSKQIIIFTGIRRCGKSTLMHWIKTQQQAHYSINFDDDRLIPFQITDFDALIEVFIELYGLHDTFYFDEIQNIPNWERFIRRLHHEGKKIFITGSNAHLLSHELGTHLTGRYISMPLFPFSFHEYMYWRDQTLLNITTLSSTHIALIKKYFIEYKTFGGLPEYLENKQKIYLHTLFESILYKDIIVKHKLTQERPIKELVYFLASNNTKMVSYNSLKKIIHIANASTIAEYCCYLENSYVCFLLSRFSYSVKKQIHYAKKIYFIDPALAESLGFRFNEERGRILENIVFLHLRSLGKTIYFHAETHECDFVIREGHHITAVIQVCEHLQHAKTKEKEYAGLIEAMHMYHLKQGFIIVEEGSAITETIHIKNEAYHIHIIPCWQWLLERSTAFEEIR